MLNRLIVGSIYLSVVYYAQFFQLDGEL